MKSLRGRLFAATLGAVVATLVLTVAIGAVLTRRQVDRSQASSLARRADDLATRERQRPSYVVQDYRAGAVRVLVRPRARFRTLVPDVNRADEGRLALEGDHYLFSYRTLPHRAILLLRPATSGSAEWRPFLRDLLLAGLVGGLLAAALSYLLARSIVRPIARVAEASRLLAEEEVHEPLPIEGSTELAALSRAFNEMAEQLHASREAERAFLLSVSHELKTPLTAIRGYAEGLADGAFGADEAARTIKLEALRLERLVRDILDLARMNRREFAVRRESVNLAEIARQVVARHATAAQSFQVALRAEGEQAWAEVDSDRVLQVASNLVENALRETPAGGTVTVCAEPGRLVVSDTGPGLAADDLPRAFERFFLYDKAGRDRSVGSGLGLAIVQQLARAMGGEVAVESAPGAGARFVVSLPPGTLPPGTPPSGTQSRGVDDLEVGAVQPAERV